MFQHVSASMIAHISFLGIYRCVICYYIHIIICILAWKTSVYQPATWLVETEKHHQPGIKNIKQFKPHNFRLKEHYRSLSTWNWSGLVFRLGGGCERWFRLARWEFVSEDFFGQEKPTDCFAQTWTPPKMNACHLKRDHFERVPTINFQGICLVFRGV